MQRQLGAHAAVQVGYVGSAGRKLFRYRDINQADPARRAAFDDGPFAPTATFFYINQFESTATLQLQRAAGEPDACAVARLDASTLDYTLGHSTTTPATARTTCPTPSQPDDSFDPEPERADSNFDVRHRLIWYFT